MVYTSIYILHAVDGALELILYTQPHKHDTQMREEGEETEKLYIPYINTWRTHGKYEAYSRGDAQRDRIERRFVTETELVGRGTRLLGRIGLQTQHHYIC